MVLGHYLIVEETHRIAGVFCLWIDRSDKFKQSVSTSSHFIAKDGMKKIVLIIDDEERNHRLMKRRLMRANINYVFEIVTCMSGKEALAYMGQHVEERYLVITDGNMPQMDGIDFLLECYEQYRNKICYSFLCTSDPKMHAKAMKYQLKDTIKLLGKPYMEDYWQMIQDALMLFDEET